MSRVRGRINSLSTGRYDDWKATDRNDPGASTSNTTLPPRETCEKCGGSVAGISVSWCKTGHHYSYHPHRPERINERKTVAARLAANEATK